MSLFFSYFCPRKPIYNERITVVDRAVDRFVDAVNRGSSYSPCLIATGRISSKFGALAERFCEERIWPQILKIFRKEIIKSGSYSVRGE
jgi:hypothetical protein